MEDPPRFTVTAPYLPVTPAPPTDPSLPRLGTNLAQPLTAEKAVVIRRVTAGRVAWCRTKPAPSVTARPAARRIEAKRSTHPGWRNAKVVRTVFPCISNRSKLSGCATKSNVTTVFPL